MPQPRLTDPPASTLSLDPAFDALTPDEQAQAWWRGTDDENAVRAGDDVEWAHDEYFPSGLGRSRLKDEDWARVAYFIAAGVSATEVAKHFGVSRSTIWRGMQRSSGLRHRVQAERRMFQRESDNRFVALRHAVVDGLQHAISAGNIRVLLWAADRLDLGGTLLPADQRPDRPPRRRRLPRLRRAPAAVQDILMAADRADGPDPSGTETIPKSSAPAPETRPEAPPVPAPADPAAPAAASVTPAASDLLPGADPGAGPIALTPDPQAPFTLAPLTLAPLALVLRRRREPVRRLLGRLRREPPLAENVDVHIAEALVANSQHHGLPRLICTAAEPLNPYRPLRRYRWP